MAFEKQWKKDFISLRKNVERMHALASGLLKISLFTYKLGILG